jgi:hypothetical protein
MAPLKQKGDLAELMVAADPRDPERPEPAYPARRGLPRDLMELAGLEPAAFRMQTERSPN